MTLETSPQEIQLTCKGLFTMPNALSQVPDGSCLIAQNVVVDYDGLLSGRRGIRQFGTSLQTITGSVHTNIFQEFFYAGSKLIWFGDVTVSDTNPARFYFGYDSDNLGTWIETTHPFSPPAYAFTDTYRSVQSNGNFYMTSTTGLLKTDAPSHPLIQAGGLPGLDGTATLTGASGFMATNTEVAYRMTWTTTDANHNDVQGTPSTRVIVSNSTGGSRNVILVFTIPHGTKTTDQYTIYRSLMSASSTTQPSDELQLTIQGFPSSTDLTNGFFTVTDSTPESLLGAALYTNSGQEGIAQANNIPPLANDVCFFQGYVIYGAATTQNKFLLSLLSTNGVGALMIGDTFTVTTGLSSFTLTAEAAENIPAAQFKVFSGGDPASDILNTKQSLIRVLNRQSQTQVYAYDSTDVNSASSLPGDFVLQEQGISRIQFGVSSSNSTAWFPKLTVVPSDNLSLAGGFIGSGYCSKFEQPEAVPIANTISVGNKYFEWLRCLPLRNSVIVLKADGCFQLTGTAFPFTVTTLDLGTILTAPESPTVMSNQVFAFTNQGVVAITETGPGIISRPIENELQEISSYLHPNFPEITFGTSYETDRKWIMSTVSSVDNFQLATIQYVYDIITQTWTTYQYPIALWDLHESPTEHRLYAASADATYPFMFQERKAFANSDFADIEIPTTITAFSGTMLTVTSTAGAHIGWSIAQLSAEGDNEPSIVSVISVITNIVDSTHIVVKDIKNWNLAASFTAYEQPINIDVLFTPIIGVRELNGARGNPGTVKFFQEIQLFFQNIAFDSITFNFSSDFVASTTPVIFTPFIQDTGWGTFPWGSGPWGSGAAPLQSLRNYIPLGARRAHWLNVELILSQAMVAFSFAGLVLTYRPTTTRSK
jgi:hypothetical protein